MAAGRFAEPGTDLGPCPEPCHHTDCEWIRKSAESLCRFCNKPIGYDVRFYTDPDNDKNFVHALCIEKEYEK